MSYFVGGALIVSAVGGAVASNKASKDQQKGIQKGLDQSSALAQQARNDVMGLFERSSRNTGVGMKAALDYYKTASPARISPYLKGNQQAQQVIGQGAEQANNAILGMPVDMSFTNQPQVTVDRSHLIGAEIPDYAALDPIVVPAPQAEEQAQTKSKGSSTVGKIMDKTTSSVTKKILKKLF